MSVVVATHRRPQALGRLLEALTLQRSAPRFEVVVIDDASGDDTVGTLRDWEGRGAFDAFRWRSLARNGGPGVARNVGWRLAGGEVIAFTDDDCRPDPLWLANLIRPVMEQRADVSTGPVRPDPCDRVTSLWVHTFTLDGRVPAFATCNIAYRRSLLEELGGFDERFTTGEDVDLGFRAIEHRARISYAPEALVLHARNNLTYRQYLRTRTRWVSAFQAYRRHPELRQYLYLRLFRRRGHAVTWAELFILAAGSAVSPWVGLGLLAARVVGGAFRPAPLPGLANRVVYSALRWVSNVVDVGTSLVGSWRARVVVL